MAARHPELAGFAASSETRQLFALDRETGLVVQLPEGEADAFREHCRSGRYVCPIESCEAPAYVAVGGASRRHHFRHRAPAAGGHAPETWLHEMAKYALAHHLQTRYPHATVFADTKAIDGGQRPDVLVEIDGHQLAFEVQYSSLTVDEWRKRHAGYQEAGIHDVWLFGNRLPHFRQARTSPLDFAISLSDLLWEVHQSGMHVRFIGPDALAIATVLVESGDRYDRVLGGFGLALDPLSACEIVDGRFVVLTDAVEDAARERRETEQRALEDEQRREHAAWEQKQRQWQAERNRREARLRWREANADKIAVFKQRRRQEHEEAWSAAEPRFLKLVGLPETPAIIAHEIRGDRGIWMHPAHWHAQLYWKWIHAKVGSSFSFREAGHRWYRSQGDNGKRGVTIALTAYLWELKRHGIVDFDAYSVDIQSKIEVLADLGAPPPQRPPADAGDFRIVGHAGRRVLVAPSGEIVSGFPDVAFGAALTPKSRPRRREAREARVRLSRSCCGVCGPARAREGGSRGALPPCGGQYGLLPSLRFGRALGPGAVSCPGRALPRGTQHSRPLAPVCLRLRAHVRDVRRMPVWEVETLASLRTRCVPTCSCADDVHSSRWGA